jgi:sugar lactone lactonase YvrE
MRLAISSQSKVRYTTPIRVSQSISISFLSTHHQTPTMTSSTSNNSDIKHYKLTTPWLRTSCDLGEAPYYEASTKTLRFVDIVNKKLFFAPLSLPEDSPQSDLTEYQLDYSIGTTADIAGTDSEFIFGGKYGYGIFTRSTGRTRWIKKFWTDEERKEDGGGKPGVGRTREERMRSNDGAVDKSGRYWVGAMNDPTVVDGNITDEGVLFRLDSDLSLHRMKSGVEIPNGMSWTLDDKKMYFTDSPSTKIMLQPFDQKTGQPDWNKAETFFQCPVEGGVPDGHCQDVEGCFWVACFGTGRVFRVTAEGKIVAEIELPTRCVTCPALCGTELVITTAAEEDAEKYPESAKLQGAVFKVDVGVEGCPINRFKLDVKA